MYMQVSKEQVEIANSVNLVDYLQSIGEPLKEEGSNYFRHDTHDSLVVNGRKNYFTWNSKNVSGNAITYLMNVYDLPFQSAVKKINADVGNCTVKEYERKAPIYPEKFNYNVKELPRTDEVEEYLINERKINRSLVKQLIEHDYICEDVYKNVVFKWKDETGKLIGANLQGTRIIPEEKRISPDRAYFKHVLPTTEDATFNGFNITRGYPENLYFFESPIDALSYLSLNKSTLTNCRLVSMDGLKHKTVYKVMERTTKELLKEGRSIKSSVLCVDNDTAGKEFIAKLKGFKIGGVPITSDIPNLPKGREKWDWNNELKLTSEKIIKKNHDMNLAL